MNICLIATDGSDHAEYALEIASTLSRPHQTALIVVHVVSNEEPPASVKHGVEVEFGNELENRLSNFPRLDKTPGASSDASMIMSQHGEVSQVINSIYGEQLLKKAELQLRSQGHESVTTILLEGDPAEKLIDAAREHKADLVLLGCRGLGRMKRLIGSVSQEVAHELDCHVIMVK